MREIKVRAWDKKREIFWEPIELRKLLRYLIFESMPNATAYTEIKDHFDEIVWQEFTGLKDKTGKEIYEGDVVEITNPKCQIQKAVISGVVVFEFASFGVKIARVDKWDRYNVGPPEMCWFLNITDSKIFEIIGNIYENPELVTGKMK